MVKDKYYIRKINGKEIYRYKYPEQEVHEWHTIDKDSGRLANGVMERQVIGHKNKFTITFSPMYLKDFRKVIRIFANDTVTLEYEHFFTGEISTGTFYVGANLTKERLYIDVDNHEEKTIQEKLTVNLIEH